MIDNMNLKQMTIFEELTKLNAKAGKAYMGALKVIRDLENPDRFSQSANSIRHLSGIIAREISVEFNESEKVELEEEINHFIKEKSLDQLYYAKIYVKEKSLKERLKLVIIEELDKLPSPAEKRINLLFKNWLDLHDFFHAIAHYGDIIVDQIKFEEKLYEFENLLLEILKPNEQVLIELDKLLKIDDPTQEDIDKLITLLINPSHSHYFFTKLESQKWLELLIKNGFFSEPKEKIGKKFMISSWAQGNYLIKVSHAKPEKVLGIINQFKNTKSYIAIRFLLNSILNMPSELVVKSLPTIKNWMNFSYGTYEIITLKKLTKILITDKITDGIYKILNILFQISKPELPHANLDIEEKIYLIFNEYEDFFDLLIDHEIQQKSCNFLKIMCQALLEKIRQEHIDFIKLNERIFKKKIKIPNLKEIEKDGSEIWKPSIEAISGEYEPHDVKSLLVSKIRDIFQMFENVDSELIRSCFSELSSFKSPIFRRLEIFFISKYPEIFKDLISHYLTEESFFERKEYWHEYYHLIKSQFKNLDEKSQNKILLWIDNGPNLSKISKESFETSEDYEKWKKRYTRKWKIRKLNPIKDFVKGDFKQKYEFLLKESESLENPDYLRKLYKPIVFHDSSELKKKLETKNNEDLKKFLKSWEPDPKKFPPESKEILSSSLSDLIREYPEKFEILIKEFNEIPCLYLISIIRGYREFLTKDQSIDYFSVFSLFNEILNNIDKLKIERSIEELKNPILDIKKEIAKFISKFLVITSIELNKKDANLILEIIKKLNYEVKEEHLQYKKIKEFNRYLLFYYKGTIMGSIFELYIMYLIHFSKNTELAKELNLGAIKDQIKGFLNPDYEYAEALRSIISSQLYHLFDMDELWCQSIIPLLFIQGKEYRDLWNISWESFIISYPNHVYYKVFKHLLKVYSKAIDKLTSPNISYDIKTFLIHHIIIVYLHEKQDLSDDSVVTKLFNVAYPEFTAEAMRYCTVNFYDTTILNSKNDEKSRYIKLIIKLWKYRIKNLTNFSKKRQKEYIKELQWFLVLFKKLDEEQLDFLHILNTILDLSNGYTYIYMSDVLERLKSYLELDFENVIKAILEILKGPNLDWFYNRTEQILQEIIQEVYGKYDIIQIKEDYNKIIDILTKNGYYDFKNFYIT